MSCILVVEDEDDIRDMIVEVIEDEGFETLQASSADSAVRLLEFPRLRFLVTDINLPGRLDGIDLARVAREAHPGLPVIFISGRPAKLEEARVLPGPVDFLAKPFSLTRLMQRIQRLAEPGTQSVL